MTFKVYNSIKSYLSMCKKLYLKIGIYFPPYLFFLFTEDEGDISIESSPG